MNRRRGCPRQQSDKGPVTRGPLPEHAQQKCRQQRSVNKSEDELQHVHDVIESGRHICGAHGNHDAEDRRHPAHPKVMLIAGAAPDVRLINIVGPDSVEGGDIAGHSRHEAGHQCGQAQAQHPGGKVMAQHERDRHVVLKSPVSLLWQHESTTTRLVGQRDRDHARQNYEEGKEHFWHGRDQGRAAGSRHRLCRHRALHHQKVRAPVAEREYESQTHRQPEPFDAHRI